MNISVVSDIHIDIWESLGKEKSILEKFSSKRGDILIIAGDIGEGRRYGKAIFQELFKIISSNFNEIIIVSGNHEHYQTGWNISEKLKENFCKKK